MHFALFTRHSLIPSPVIAVPGSFPYHTTMTETKITGIAMNSFTTLQHGLSHGEEAETTLQTGLSLMEKRRKQPCKPGSLSWRGGRNNPANQALSHGEEAETSLGTRLCPNSTWFTRAFLLVRGWGLGTRLIIHRPPQWFYGTQLIRKQQRWADT